MSEWCVTVRCVQGFVPQQGHAVAATSRRTKFTGEHINEWAQTAAWPQQGGGFH